MPNRALVVAALAMVVSRADADRPLEGPKLVVEYTAPTSKGVVGIPLDHVARMRVLIRFLEHQLKLPNQITISYRECGSANAYYRSYDHSIEICHELWDKRSALYTATGNARGAIDRRLRAAMTFTFFHELGHALHDELELPLLGRDEDAVDDIATLWMIRLGVGDSAQQAADGHHLRSQQPEYTHDAWDEHGTGAQRGYAIGCLLYGSDPGRYSSALERMMIPAPQIMRCQKDYAKRLGAWQVLFRPHLTTRV